MADITLDAGDTRFESVTLTSTPAIDLNSAIDITWTAFSDNRIVVRKSISAGTIALTSSTTFLISVIPDDTSPAFGVGSTTETMTYPYELWLFYSTANELIQAGNLIIAPTKAWNKTAPTAGADRTVIVQGRY
jgi:hypothetical protein